MKSGPVVVIGAGFGGLMTALSVSSHKPSPPVILIDSRSRFVFSPLLYELLSNEIQSWEVAPSYRSLLVGKGISFIKDLVVRIDIPNSILFTASGQKIRYAQLVISTGSKPFSYGTSGVAEYALQFNQMEDVAKLKQLISQLNSANSLNQSLAIVGAGPSGIELACKISDLLNDQIQIHLIELGDRVLPNGKSFNQEQALIALKKRKIQLHLKTRVLKVTADTLEFANSNGQKLVKNSLNYKCLIWLAGSKPSLPTGLPNNTLHCDGVSINSNLQVIGFKNVFAIGDVAIDMNNPMKATAQVAMQQASLLAKNLIALRDSQPLQDFQFSDRGEMLSLGIGEASITSMGFTLSGPLAFELRRLAYLAKTPSISLGMRSAGSWLIGHGKNFI